MKFNFIFLIISLLLFSVVSCENTTDATDKNFKSNDPVENTVNLEFPSDKGNVYTPPQCGPDFYPCPPYGFSRFQTMEDFPFIPANDQAKTLTDETGTAWMHNIYKLRESGKKLLVLTVTAGWCSVCRAQLPVTHAMADQYKDDVAFLIIVDQDANGAPSTLAYSENYLDGYSFDEPNIYGTYDPNGLFERYMNIAAFPFNAMIDLQNMEIISYESGLTSNSVYSDAIQSALNKISK